MKIFKSQNVYEAAVQRFEWIFDEFKNVLVTVSGGKDSTVCVELALEVARRKGRLPLKVMFLDQEAEWQHTIDYIKELMYRPEVEPYWLQVPIRLFNCTSHTENWLDCWNPEKKDLWVHPQDPIAITENTYGTDRFHKMFEKFSTKLFNNEPHAVIAGVRAGESLNRYTALTWHECYKGVTWGKSAYSKHGAVTFYPLYDWNEDDIWTYIAKSGCKYNKVYDLMFNYGVPQHMMRVSNLHHETAYHALFFLQEIERGTYERLVRRLPGIATFNTLQEENLFPRELPEMFASWAEYRDYLLETIVQPELRDNFKRMWKGQDGEDWAKEHVYGIIVNDYEATKNKNKKSTVRLNEKKAEGRFVKAYGINQST